MSPTVGSPLLWIGFVGLILVLLALDLGVFNRKPHTVGPREALIWTLIWVAAALLFNLAIYFRFGPKPALEFLTGYLIEKALSVDNLFVFVVILSYFAVPKDLQHRVLFWGVLGALVSRAAFIVAGAALLHHFSWITFVFGGFLVVTGLRLLKHTEEEQHPERNPVVRMVHRVLPTVPEYHGGSFMIVQNGKRFATPLMLALVTAEVTDVVFAIDSIPAIFAVTRDPFIVFTSNIFAILGLRSLYFLLARVLDRFHYLAVGLGLILTFVGVKMVAAPWYHIPVEASLGVIALLLAGSIVASLLRPITPGGGEEKHR